MQSTSPFKKLLMLFAFLYAVMFVSATAYGAITMPATEPRESSRFLGRSGPGYGRSTAGQRSYQAKNVPVYKRSAPARYKGFYYRPKSDPNAMKKYQQKYKYQRTKIRAY